MSNKPIAKAICDGRGNAGTGARAVVLFTPWGEIIERAERLVPTTNIVAEHLAIQLAMEVALENKIDELLIWNDSQSPVFQVQGRYQIHKADLRPLVAETWRLGRLFSSVRLEWVPRDKTMLADKLCRQVDKPSSPRPRPLPR